MGLARKTHCAKHGCERRVTVVDADKGWVETWCPVCSAERRRESRARAKAKKQQADKGLSTLYRLAIGRWG